MAGSSRPIRMARMAITTSSSISVKPPRHDKRRIGFSLPGAVEGWRCDGAIILIASPCWQEETAPLGHGCGCARLLAKATAGNWLRKRRQAATISASPVVRGGTRRLLVIGSSRSSRMSTMRFLVLTVALATLVLGSPCAMSAAEIAERARQFVKEYERKIG